MRRLAIALFAAVLLAVVAPVATVSAAPFVTVSEVSVEPTSPVPGEVTTIETTIENPQSNSGDVEITDVAVRDRDSANERVRVKNVATVSPGSSTIATLELSFDSRGQKVLSVHVYGRDVETGESIHVEQPKTITVGNQHPGLDVDVVDPVAGADNDASVQVANGLDSEIRNVKLSVEGEDLTVENGQSVVAKLESGESATSNFTVRASEPGEYTIETTLTYVTSAGTERTVTEETVLVVEELRDDVVLDTTVVGDDADRAIEVNVHNRGNADLERVSLTGSSENATVRQALVQRVPAGETETVRLNVTSTDPTADVTLEASYDIGEFDRQTSKTITVHSAPGEIELTGVQVRPQGGTVHVAGSASNVGLSDVESVVVRVAETEDVAPSAPNREYFVGTVPASDFVSFDVYATTSANATTIPVQVTYLVDGERQQRVFHYDAPVTGQVDDDSEPEQRSGGAGVLLPLVLGGAALLAVGGIVFYYYRNETGDDI